MVWTCGIGGPGHATKYHAMNFRLFRGRIERHASLPNALPRIMFKNQFVSQRRVHDEADGHRNPDPDAVCPPLTGCGDPSTNLALHLSHTMLLNYAQLRVGLVISFHCTIHPAVAEAIQELAVRI
jgi:hypothetical protein